jgi:ribosomal protein S18 acetylase RimI-like enzyme
MNKIRPYEDRDEMAVLNIYASSKMDELIHEAEKFEFMPLPHDQDRYEKLFESKIFVYDDNGVIGYCAYFENEIRALYVQPSFRGRGIDEDMLDFMLRAIAGTPVLFVAKSNVHAKKLYSKYGFAIVDEFEVQYNGKGVLANKMEKTVGIQLF